MRTELSYAPIAGIATELLAVLAADTQTAKGPDAKPQLTLLTADPAVQAAAAGVLETGEYKAGANETVLLHAPAGMAAKRLLIVGLGKLAKATVHSVRDAAGTAVRFAKPRAIREVVLSLPTLRRSAQCSRRTGCGGRRVCGRLRRRHVPKRSKGPEYPDIHACGSGEAERAEVEAAFAEGIVIGESQNFARSLVNEPGNKLTPTILGQRAAMMAQEVGLGWEVHSTEKLHELKMGAFWSVSQGSAEPPALIVLRYEPEGVRMVRYSGWWARELRSIPGGISIKPADNMEKMKYDMAGGAAMIGAMRAIALLKPKVRVIAVVCAAENMPSGTAQKPGDVQTAMSGKTIEIINTDAEGRLVLADGLTYARQLGATHLIDAATLTGAISVALGKITAGAFSNDDAAYANSNRRWRFPERSSGGCRWATPMRT